MIVVEYVCLLGDLDRETQMYGLATVLGFASMTGIAGLKCCREASLAPNCQTYCAAT